MALPMALMLGSALGTAATGLLSGNRARKRDEQMYQDISRQLNRLPAIGEKYFNPYVQRGQLAQDQASSVYDRMLSDPSAFINQIMASYKPSAGYQFRRDNALKTAQNAAASGGFSGTGYDQLQQAQMADGLLGEDMYNYLSQVLGVNDRGLMGQQHVADTGFNASSGLADMLGNAIGSRVNLMSNMHRQRQQSSANRAQMVGQGFGLLGGLGKSLWDQQRFNKLSSR